MLALDFPHECAQSVKMIREISNKNSLLEEHTLTGRAGGTVLWGGIVVVINILN